VSESTNIRERKRKKKGEKAERNFFGRDINDVTAFLSLSLSLSLLCARVLGKTNTRARFLSFFFLHVCRDEKCAPNETNFY